MSTLDNAYRASKLRSMLINTALLFNVALLASVYIRSMITGGK